MMHPQSYRNWTVLQLIHSNTTTPYFLLQEKEEFQREVFASPNTTSLNVHTRSTTVSLIPGIYQSRQI